MNDLIQNKKTPEANLKDCVLSLAEIVESLVEIQQQTSSAERVKECSENEYVKQKKEVAPIKSESERQFAVRYGAQMFRTSTPGSNGNYSRSYARSSTFTQQCHPQTKRLDGAGQTSKENLVAKNYVRLHDKPSGHTQKRSSQSKVSSRPLEECLSRLTDDAIVTNHACVCSPSRQKKNENARNQSAKLRIALKEKVKPASYLSQNCNKRIKRSENEDIQAENSELWQYVNDPCYEVPSSSKQEAVNDLGSGNNRMKQECTWKMMERLQCIEEDLENLTRQRQSNQDKALNSKHKARYGKSGKSPTDEFKHSTMSLEEKRETIGNDCIDDLKEIFAELQVEVPDGLWTDPRKARFFLDIVLDLLEGEVIQKTDLAEAKGESSSNELDSRKELFIKELEKSLETKTPQPTSAVKLLELIYLQRGKNAIGRIKTQNIFRDDRGRTSQNCGVVSGKVDPFQLLALNSEIATQSRDNTTSKPKNALKGIKDESDEDTGHSEEETYGSMDRSFKDQYTPTRMAKSNMKTERSHSVEHRFCYCEENNKKENAEDSRSRENIQKGEDSPAELSQNVFIKPDPDSQELPQIKTEGLLGQEQITADTESNRKMSSPHRKDFENIEIPQEKETLPKTKYTRRSDSLDQVRMDISKSGDLTEVTSLKYENPPNRMESKIIPQKLNKSGELSGLIRPGLPNVEPVGTNIDFRSRPNGVEPSSRNQTRSKLSTIDQTDIVIDAKKLSEQIHTSPGRSLTGITNKEDFNKKGPLAQFPQQFTTPTGRPNMPTVAREIDFDAENSLISDSENELDKYQPEPESPDLVAFSNFGQGARTSNAKDKAATKKNDIATNDPQTIERDSTATERNSAHLVKSGDNREALIHQTGSALQNRAEKHTKSKLNFLTSCISSPEKEESTSIAPQEDFFSIRNLHKEESTNTRVIAPQEFQSIHKLHASKTSNFAPNETSYRNTQDAPSYRNLTDKSLQYEASTYSTPHDITPKIENQTTAEHGVETLSKTANLKLPNSLSPEGPSASSTLKETAEIETPRIDTDTLETVNRTKYDVSTVTSPPLSPDHFNAPLGFGAAYSSNLNPQLDSSPAGPTDLPDDRFSPIISTPPKIDRDESVIFPASTPEGKQSKGDSPKSPEGYESLDDMIEVTLRGFEKMSIFLQKEPRITASPNLPDDPNELNKVFAAKITEMENTLSAVINCIQCTLVEMSRVIEKRCGISIPEAHLHDDPKFTNLHCSEIFEACKKDINESSEGKNDLEED